MSNGSVTTTFPGKPSSFQAQTHSFEFDPWLLTTKKSHILPSQCKNSEQCKQQNKCSFCRFEEELSKLPKLPEMVFAENVLQIQHKLGEFGIEFNALDALRLVDTSQDGIKVAVAEAWRESRAESEHIKDVINPFDWTFTTNYMGSLFCKSEGLKVSATAQRIDMEKLKEKEKILFYDDILLFEDELADNGCAFLSVKVRAMPSGFFVLCRFYLRVDNVLVRIHDTRLYYEAQANFLLREYSTRESRMSELEKLPPSVITDPNEVYRHLTLKEECFQKLDFPI